MSIKKIIVFCVSLHDARNGFDFEEEQSPPTCVDVIINGPMISNYLESVAMFTFLAAG